MGVAEPHMGTAFTHDWTTTDAKRAARTDLLTGRFTSLADPFCEPGYNCMPLAPSCQPVGLASAMLALLFWVGAFAAAKSALYSHAGQDGAPTVSSAAPAPADNDDCGGWRPQSHPCWSRRLACPPIVDGDLQRRYRHGREALYLGYDAMWPRFVRASGRTHGRARRMHQRGKARGARVADDRQTNATAAAAATLLMPWCLGVPINRFTAKSPEMLFSDFLLPHVPESKAPFLLVDVGANRASSLSPSSPQATEALRSSRHPRVCHAQGGRQCSSEPQCALGGRTAAAAAANGTKGATFWARTRRCTLCGRRCAAWLGEVLNDGAHHNERTRERDR